MFKRWIKKRALLKIQEECFHEYHIVSTYEDFDSYSYDFFTRHDIYCPICDKTVYSVSDAEAKREITKRKLRDEYRDRRL